MDHGDRARRTKKIAGGLRAEGHADVTYLSHVSDHERQAQQRANAPARADQRQNPATKRLEAGQLLPGGGREFLEDHGTTPGQVLQQ